MKVVARYLPGRKTKSVRLSGTVVRVLPENDNLGLFRGTMIKGIENEFSRRIYLRGLVLVFHELDQLGEIRFLKFIFKSSFQEGSIFTSTIEF